MSGSSSIEETPQERKKILRQEARRHRARIRMHADDGEKVARYFFEAFPVDMDYKCCSLYYPMGREIDIHPLCENLWETGKTCALPVCSIDDKVMRFAEWKADSDFEIGLYKVPAPKVSADKEWRIPDIVIMPLLAFDRRGYRLGQGGGNYDATLKSLRAEKDVIAVGVGYADQACLFPLPSEEHDEPLDMVITPKGITQFS